jgi:spermidine/putrescine transport system ATP-binding protein
MAGPSRETPVEDLRLVEVTKAYGPVKAVDDLSLTIPGGSFFALLGPSGCGKTTALRMVAGLEEPTSGRVFVGERDITGLRPFRRPVNTVFQSYALFPHLDIFENVAFGLRRRGIKDVKGPVEAMLELVELTPMARRKPAQLSGGQQQRVAVARALINEPDVLLLDEPLGALDLKLRRQMQIELKRIQVEVGTTFVHVTHDQEEAMTMADTIAVMNRGRIEQMGVPTQIYENPATVFVANFLGQCNLIPARITGGDGDRAVVDAHGHSFGVPRARIHVDGNDVIVGVRPEKLTIYGLNEEVPSGFNQFRGVVTDAAFIGVSSQYLVRAPWGQEISVFEQNLALEDLSRRGEEVIVAWAPGHSFALPGTEGVDAGADSALTVSAG